jgi:hypothetical protein
MEQGRFRYLLAQAPAIRRRSRLLYSNKNITYGPDGHCSEQEQGQQQEQR